MSKDAKEKEDIKTGGAVRLQPTRANAHWPQAMDTVFIADERHEATLQQLNRVPITLVVLYAYWCGYSRKFLNTIKFVAKQLDPKKAQILLLDADQWDKGNMVSQGLPTELGVLRGRGVPMSIVWDSQAGMVVNTNSANGYASTPKEIQATVLTGTRPLRDVLRAFPPDVALRTAGFDYNMVEETTASAPGAPPSQCGGAAAAPGTVADTTGSARAQTAQSAQMRVVDRIVPSWKAGANSDSKSATNDLRWVEVYLEKKEPLTTRIVREAQKLSAMYPKSMRVRLHERKTIPIPNAHGAAVQMVLPFSGAGTPDSVTGGSSVLAQTNIRTLALEAETTIQVLQKLQLQPKVQ